MRRMARPAGPPASTGWRLPLLLLLLLPAAVVGFLHVAPTGKPAGPPCHSVRTRVVGGRGSIGKATYVHKITNEYIHHRNTGTTNTNARAPSRLPAPLHAATAPEEPPYAALVLKDLMMVRTFVYMCNQN